MAKQVRARTKTTIAGQGSLTLDLRKGSEFSCAALEHSRGKLEEGDGDLGAAVRAAQRDDHEQEPLALGAATLLSSSASASSSPEQQRLQSSSRNSSWNLASDLQRAAGAAVPSRRSFQ